MLVKEATGQLRVLWAVCFEILHPSLSDHNNAHFKLNIAKPVSVRKEVFAANRNPWTKHNFLEIKLILTVYFASLQILSKNTILCLANFQISMTCIPINTLTLMVRTRAPWYTNETGSICERSWSKIRIKYRAYGIPQWVKTNYQHVAGI